MINSIYEGYKSILSDLNKLEPDDCLIRIDWKNRYAVAVQNGGKIVFLNNLLLLFDTRPSGYSFIGMDRSKLQKLKDTLIQYLNNQYDALIIPGKYGFTVARLQEYLNGGALVSNYLIHKGKPLTLIENKWSTLLMRVASKFNKNLKLKINVLESTKVY